MADKVISKDAVESFYVRIPERSTISKADIADHFAYFLQVELGYPVIRAADITRCFVLADLGAPKWIATHLTNKSKAPKGKPSVYVKATPGYRLHATSRDLIAANMGKGSEISQSSSSLEKIFFSLPGGAQKEFLGECIESYKVGCNRAAVIMFWLFIMDHLFELVTSKHLSNFDAILAANTDKRVKVSSITKRDDFGEIPEGKFVEFLKSAGVISGDVRKILDQKLGTRNTAAHPSTVKFKASKASEFFDDLIENVYKKYSIA